MMFYKVTLSPIVYTGCIVNTADYFTALYTLDVLFRTNKVWVF